MLKNYLKIAFRNIIKNKRYSFINIFGLAVGIAAFSLIVLYVQYEFSFDKYNTKGNRIYRVLNEWQGQYTEPFTPGPLAPKLIDELPEVVTAARLRILNNIIVNYDSASFYEDNLVQSDPQIFKIFSFGFIHGDAKTALNNPNSIVISKRIAEKYFGTENPIGKNLRISNSLEFKITGVINNTPDNSHIIFDFLIPLSHPLTDWKTMQYVTYILLNNNVNPKEAEAKCNRIVQSYFNFNPLARPSNQQKFHFQNLFDIHFQTNIRGETSTTNVNVVTIYVLISIAFLILIIASINYINLNTARALRQIKDFGVRKVIGASRKQLIYQHLSHSIISTAISFSLALVFIEIILPSFSSFINRKLNFASVGWEVILLYSFVFIVFVGLATGAYPAFRTSSYSPIKLLNNDLIGYSKKSAIRNALVIFQFSISIILIVYLLTIEKQLNYLKTKDTGYNKEQIVILNIRDRGTLKNAAVIKNSLLQNPAIKYVSFSNHLPDNIQNAVPMEFPGNPGRTNIPLIYFTVVDKDFLDLYNIKILKGRNFYKNFTTDNQGSFLLNETAAKELGWDNPLWKNYHMIWNNCSGKIVGIIKDFNYHSLREKIGPMLLYYNPDKKYYRYISIKIRAGHITPAINYIRSVMHKISPDIPFEYRFFDEEFNRTYLPEMKLEQFISTFSFIAILLASLGLLGLMSITAEAKTKEIGVRKVLGASGIQIVFLLSKEFAKCIMIAIFIAFPIAYYLVSRWLLNFAYKITPDVWIYLFAVLLTSFIAGITVSYQSYKAATANPIKALRYE